MKKLLTILLSLALLATAAAALTRMTRLASGSAHTPAPVRFEATERFTGTIGGVPYQFEDSNFTRYRMSVANIVTEGELNTERGYGTDPDATVYVLDWDKPESEQKFFVRMSASSSQLQQLDSARAIIPRAVLSRE